MMRLQRTSYSFMQKYSIPICYIIMLQMGFDSLFFARIDYQDRAKRRSDKTLEVIWQGSRSLSSSSQVIFHSQVCSSFLLVLWLLLSPSHFCNGCWILDYLLFTCGECWSKVLTFCHVHFQIFTGIFPVHYDPPEGFTFEINDVSDPIQVVSCKRKTMLSCANCSGIYY